MSLGHSFEAPAVVDLCMLSPVEAVLVDDIPLASAAPAMQAYRRRPMRRPPIKASSDSQDLAA